MGNAVARYSGDDSYANGAGEIIDVRLTDHGHGSIHLTLTWRVTKRGHILHTSVSPKQVGRSFRSSGVTKVQKRSNEGIRRSIGPSVRPSGGHHEEGKHGLEDRKHHRRRGLTIVFDRGFITNWGA